MTAPSVSQSVVRLVRVLELFEREKRPLTSAEIGAFIGAPRSSTAALLRSMVDMSVLWCDRKLSTYLPTARFGQLAGWINDRMAFDPSVVDAVRRLVESTAETITLAALAGQWTELILVERGTLPIAFHVDPGERIRLWGSAVGTAYLTTLPNPSIAALYQRCLDLPDELKPNEPLAKIYRRVGLARRQGYAFIAGAYVMEGAAISVPIPSHLTVRPTTLTVAGPTQRLRTKRDLIVRALMTEVGKLSAAKSIESTAA